MEHLLLILPALVCPLGMGLCMWMMARHMGSSGQKGEAQTMKEPDAELTESRSDSEQKPIASALPGPASKV